MGIQLLLIHSYMYMLILIKDKSTAKINAIRLIRESSIDAKRWVYKASETVLLMDGLELLDIRVVEGNELTVLVDARRGDGFGEDRGVAGDYSR